MGVQSIAVNPSTKKAFTLVELIAVIALLALMFAIIFPTLEAMFPSFQIRSAARMVASTMEESLAESAIHGQDFGIRYDIDNKRFGLLLPEEFGEEEVKNKGREVLQWIDLEAGLEIRGITLPDGNTKTAGVIDVIVDRLGAEGSHIVQIESNTKNSYWIKFNSYTGIVYYSQKELVFPKFEGKSL